MIEVLCTRGVFESDHRYIASLLDAIANGIEPRASGNNGRKTLETTIALRESHRRGHIPVQLLLEDRHQTIVLAHASLTWCD